MTIFRTYRFGRIRSVSHVSDYHVFGMPSALEIYIYNRQWQYYYKRYCYSARAVFNDPNMPSQSFVVYAAVTARVAGLFFTKADRLG